MKREEIVSKVAAEIENIASKKLEDYDEEIYKSGFLDSLNVLHVIVFIENTFDLKIDTFELTIDSLGTVNRIADFVAQKLSEK
jgi:acyl carrier protein